VPFCPVFIQPALESSGPIQQLVLVIIFVHLKPAESGHIKKDANDFDNHFTQVFGSTHYAKWSNCELIGGIISVKQLLWRNATCPPPSLLPYSSVMTSKAENKCPVPCSCSLQTTGYGCQVLTHKNTNTHPLALKSTLRGVDGIIDCN